MFKTPTSISIEEIPPSLNEIDLSLSIDEKSDYEKKLNKWQKRMLAVQQAYYRQNRKAIIVFEGWDASGKGGAIRRLTEKLDPRGFHVHPISAPSVEESKKHYLYRFQTKLPSDGEITIFDRSYYGRVLVERVEGFATDYEWQRAYQEINEFERLMTDDNCRIIKIFIHIDKDEQAARFNERVKNPYKRWKMTDEDIRNRAKWNDYYQATNDMFAQTSTKLAPWQVVPGNHKWYARTEILKIVVKALEHSVDVEPPQIDKKILTSTLKLNKNMKIIA